MESIQNVIVKIIDMTEWKTHKIGDLCDTISDTYKGCADEVVLINTSDVLEGKCLNHTKEPNRNLKGQFKKTFKKYDILYSEIRPANKRFAYIDFDATNYIASTKLMVLRHNEKIEPLYLYYILQSQSIIDELQMLAESRSGTFPQITFAELSRLEVKLPNREVQRQILGILSAIDDKIENNRRINTNLELQAQALFEEWMQSCQNKVLIKDLADNILDYTPNTNRKVVLLNSSDVTEGLFAELPLVDNVNLKGQFKKRFQKDDILYSEIRPRNKHYAYCYFDSDRYIASTRLIVLRGKKDKIISNTLLYQYIISQNVFEEFTLKTETRSGTFPQGNYQDLSMIEVPFSENQQEIAHSLDVIYEEIWSNYKENETLSTLRDTLLPKLMNGEIKL